MNIYVGNVSYGVTNQDLQDLFAKFGTVTSAKVIVDNATGRSKGFGFVEMADASEGAKAIKELDGKELKDRAIRVNEARPKENNSKGSYNKFSNRR